MRSSCLACFTFMLLAAPASADPGLQNPPAAQQDNKTDLKKPASVPQATWDKLSPADKQKAVDADAARVKAEEEQKAATAKAQEARKAADAAGVENDVNQFGFGVGIGVSRLGEDADILETELVNGVIRVTDTENIKRGIWLETHYMLDRFTTNWNYASHGPFFGVQAGTTGSVINSVAFGYMFSLKRTPKWDKENKAAFNFGLGLFTTKISRLADGYSENQRLPESAESVLLRKQARTGVMAMFSFTVF